jgi:hypothetical protein
VGSGEEEAMSWSIPQNTKYVFKKGDRGIGVWAIQRAIQETWTDPSGLVVDGIFGRNTDTWVRYFQAEQKLTVDGVFGPASSAAMVPELEATVSVKVPDGLIRGLVEGESGNLIAAVNWSVPGGVDCGYVQRRVYTPADDATIQRAFNSGYQLNLLGRSLRDWHDRYLGKPGASTHEKAWRCATVRHNYPAGADKVADLGPENLSSYYTTAQAWVEDIGAHFPDGTPIRTPLGWMEHYALGNPAHSEPGTMTKYVQTWTT